MSISVFMKSSVFQNTYHKFFLIDFCPGRFYRLVTYVECYAPLLTLLITEKKCIGILENR